MSSCWSSALAAVVAGDPDDKECMRRRLIVGKADTEAAENHLEHALAAAEEAAAAVLRSAEEEHEPQVEELPRTAEESDATDARIRELEERIKTISNRIGKWSLF